MGSEVDSGLPKIWRARGMAASIREVLPGISGPLAAVLSVYTHIYRSLLPGFLPFSPLQRRMGYVLGGGLDVGIYFVMENVWWMGPIPRKLECCLLVR